MSTYSQSDYLSVLAKELKRTGLSPKQIVNDIIYDENDAEANAVQLLKKEVLIIKDDLTKQLAEFQKMKNEMNQLMHDIEQEQKQMQIFSKAFQLIMDRERIDQNNVEELSWYHDKEKTVDEYQALSWHPYYEGQDEITYVYKFSAPFTSFQVTGTSDVVWSDFQDGDVCYRWHTKTQTRFLKVSVRPTKDKKVYTVQTNRIDFSGTVSNIGGDAFKQRRGNMLPQVQDSIHLYRDDFEDGPIYAKEVTPPVYKAIEDYDLADIFSADAQAYWMAGYSKVLIAQEVKDLQNDNSIMGATSRTLAGVCKIISDNGLNRTTAHELKDQNLTTTLETNISRPVINFGMSLTFTDVGLIAKEDSQPNQTIKGDAFDADIVEGSKIIISPIVGVYITGDELWTGNTSHEYQVVVDANTQGQSGNVLGPSLTDDVIEGQASTDLKIIIRREFTSTTGKLRSICCIAHDTKLEPVNDTNKNITFNTSTFRGRSMPEADLDSIDTNTPPTFIKASTTGNTALSKAFIIDLDIIMRTTVFIGSEAHSATGSAVVNVDYKKNGYTNDSKELELTPMTIQYHDDIMAGIGAEYDINLEETVVIEGSGEGVIDNTDFWKTFVIQTTAANASTPLNMNVLGNESAAGIKTLIGTRDFIDMSQVKDLEKNGMKTTIEVQAVGHDITWYPLQTGDSIDTTTKLLPSMKEDFDLTIKTIDLEYIQQDGKIGVTPRENWDDQEVAELKNALIAVANESLSEEDELLSIDKQLEKTLNALVPSMTTRLEELLTNVLGSALTFATGIPIFNLISQVIDQIIDTVAMIRKGLEVANRAWEDFSLEVLNDLFGFCSQFSTFRDATSKIKGWITQRFAFINDLLNKITGVDTENDEGGQQLKNMVVGMRDDNSEGDNSIFRSVGAYFKRGKWALAQMVMTLSKEPTTGNIQQENVPTWLDVDDDILYGVGGIITATKKVLRLKYNNIQSVKDAVIILFYGAQSNDVTAGTSRFMTTPITLYCGKDSLIAKAKDSKAVKDRIRQTGCPPFKIDSGIFKTALQKFDTELYQP